MDENNAKEKKKLKLKLKTFSDLKRFKSRQLHKIVEKFRKKNKGMSLEELIEDVDFFKIMGYAIRQSLINRSDRNRKETIERLKKEVKAEEKGRKEYSSDLKEGKITEEEQKKMQKESEYRIYKMNKEIYEKDLGPKNQEKPKNPKIERAINNVKNAAKTVGKGIVAGAGMVAGAVAFPFVMTYKGAKAVVKVTISAGKRIGRGAQVTYLTAGKVAANVKDQVQTAKTQTEREMFENASEKVQEEIKTNAHAKALKENAKRDREAARRESLHMDKEEQPINHQEAIEKVEGEILTPEEEKEVYGDQEK